MTAKPILIAYATKGGATAETALAVCRVLAEAGATVELLPLDDVREVSGFRAVILGTAIRVGQPLVEALAFAEQYQAALAQMPVAVFSVGITMREDTPESRAKALGDLAPLLSYLPKPVSVGLFAGRLKSSQLELFAASRPGEAPDAVHEGDWRDWEAIRAWAAGLAQALGQPAAGAALVDE